MSVVYVGSLALPPVFLAPMAGITDLPFRTTALELGAGLVVSEMVASSDLVQSSASARAKMNLGTGRERTAVQIAGREEYWMAEAARMCEAEGAPIIDINFGCPAKKVTSGWSGSALMRDPNRALRLVEAVVAAVRVPVTLKMRLGWDHDQMNAPLIARQAEMAGVQMITVHGRTRCQFYKGQADWNAIAAVRDAIDVPLIANGDITDLGSARTAMSASGADGAMVGRAARGQPWILSQIAANMAGKHANETPTAGKKKEIILVHYDRILSFYGSTLGLRVARKHLGWYLERIEGCGALRRRALTANEPRDVIEMLQNDFPDDDAAFEKEVA